jgi:hypothetical protein
MLWIDVYPTTMIKHIKSWFPASSSHPPKTLNSYRLKSWFLLSASPQTQNPEPSSMYPWFRTPSRSDVLEKVVLGTIPAGSECALAKMVGYVTALSAAFVILKGHRVRPIDVLNISQGKRVMYSVCGVGWGIPGKLAEESESMRLVHVSQPHIVPHSAAQIPS